MTDRRDDIRLGSFKHKNTTKPNLCRFAVIRRASYCAMRDCKDRKRSFTPRYETLLP